MMPTIAPLEVAPTATGATQAQRLIAVSLPCQGVEPMQVLRLAAGQERFYWQDPRAHLTYVGLGIAADLCAWGGNRFQAIAQQTADLYANARILGGAPPFAEPHLFGGFAFSDDFTPDNTWSIYHPAQFILPHYQLAIEDTGQGRPQGWLTINVLLDADENEQRADTSDEEVASALQNALEERLAQWQAAAPLPPFAALQLQARNYPMSFLAWERMIRQALDEFRAGRLEKVVLARVCELRFRQTVAVENALAHLNIHYPECYRFVFEPRPHHAFFGASPELLVNLKDEQVDTMGLAGSERRGGTPVEDLRLEQALLNSAKDRHEHQLVVDAIGERLTPLCSELSIPSTPELLKLKNIQHLYTPISGALRQAKTIFDLLERLHPTPALGGAPRQRALAFISENEPAPRGWYAAPVGIVNRRLEGSFSVAIRSAVTEYERVWLHAGAGIVAASDPQKEWEETALKFRPILNALGVG